jgi:hypothetical protein
MARDHYQFQIVLYCVILFLAFPTAMHAQKRNNMKRTSSETIASKKINLEKELRVFNNGIDSANYYVSLCADIPNDKDPMKVQFDGETGHVFLILQKINFNGDTLSKVFGFYPKGGGLPTVFTRNVKSAIKDNSGRIYDASVSLQLSGQEFDLVIKKSVELSKYRYKLNKFNCYDYALHVFNSVTGKDTIPIHYVKFPFIFGKGGSPCSLFNDLVWLKENNINLSPFIWFSKQLAPVSSTAKDIGFYHISTKPIGRSEADLQITQNQ